MSFLTKPSLSRRFQLVRVSFQQRDGLPFADVLTESHIKDAFAAEEAVFAEAEEDVYTPAVTVWAFSSQILFKGEHRCPTGKREKLLWSGRSRGQSVTDDQRAAGASTVTVARVCR